MSEEYSREVLRRTVAQVCQLIGWHGIASTPLDVLVHCLEKYMLTLATRAHRYAEHYRRTEPNLDDLGLAFGDVGVRLAELKEYCECVPPTPPPANLCPPRFPLPREDKLHFLRPGAAEVLTRPQHVHDHLPPTLPPNAQAPRSSPPPPVASTVEVSNEDPNADPNSVFKRPASPLNSLNKKPRIRLEGEELHARELSSVMMTVSGFLSPAREGKLPEARTPVVIPDAPPDRARPGEPPPFRPPPAIQKERPDKKPKKNKQATVNGKVEKVKPKKEKPLKRPPIPLPKGKVPPVDLFKPDIPEKKPLLQPPPQPIRIEPPIPIKAIKKEQIDEPLPQPTPMRLEPPVPRLPEPRKQPPPPPINNEFNIDNLPIKIKVEKPDPEKLPTQPDRSKLNIFKKIPKPKDEKAHDLSYDRAVDDNTAVKIEKSRDEPRLFESKPKPSNGSNSNFAVDLTSKKNDNQSIEEPFDITKTKIKQEPPDDYPKDLSRPKLSLVPENILTGAVVKEKKEKKRKERKTKDERMKGLDMLVKKQREIQKLLNPENRDGAAGPMFPFSPFPMGPGLIPNYGASPSLIPGGGLFSSFMDNPAFRGLLPQDGGILPNPFSVRGAVPNLINPNLLPTAPGLVPAAISNPHLTVNHSFGQAARMPQPPNLPQFLRRPSLEVIPIDEDEESRVKPTHKQQIIPPSLIIKEKEKSKNNRLNVNNSFISNNVSASVINQSPSPKNNSIIAVDQIKPDVTIKLNPPVEKVKIEPKKELPPPPPSLTVEEQRSIPSIPKEKDKDKSEKKKDKLHKKEKKDKEQKIKKKKDKKDKLLKLEKKKEKLEKQELKDRLKKEKKEKRKEKEKAVAAAAAATAPTSSSVVEGVVPKLTLKLGSSSPMMPPSPDTTRKLNIKPVVKKEESPLAIVLDPEPKIHSEESPSPELARISALVTRPPKSKSSNKHNSVVKTEANTDSGLNTSPPGSQPSGSSPARTKTLTKFKRIFFKPIPKRNSSDYDDSIMDLEDDSLMKDPKNKIPNIPAGAHFYKDPQGNQVWICPACSMPDNGTPMIGCDGCDGWYHWVCVGIHVEPDDSEDWYCTSCIAKRTAMASAQAASQTGKKRGRKPKAEKLNQMQNR